MPQKLILYSYGLSEESLYNGTKLDVFYCEKKDSPSEKIFCMLHIQTTSQQTLEFSPRLIKVGYFVVFGYWSKTRQITLEFGFT